MLKAAYSGDRDAFVSLYQQVFAPRYVPSRRRPFAEPAFGEVRRDGEEDLVSDAIVKALATREKPIAQWNPERGGVLNWLNWILVHQIASYCRTKKGKAIPMSCLAPVDHEGESTPFENTSPDRCQTDPHHEADEAERHERLRTVIRSLSRLDREILAMRVDESKTLDEISRVLGVSKPTACRRLQAIGQIVAAQVRDLPAHFESLRPD